ncbi:MAG: hypothetical protein HRT89_17380 [Lentisphaeria bacterium]|nr:hypothetical protein [Lentisphaeria bacterium]
MDSRFFPERAGSTKEAGGLNGTSTIIVGRNIVLGRLVPIPIMIPDGR